MSESKKTIKLNYCGCGNELRPNNNPIHNILKKHFNYLYLFINKTLSIWSQSLSSKKTQL